MNALDGLRVLEASDGIAGAYAGKLLRDQGADVVKLDVDARLQHWSAATPDVPVEGTGALVAFLNGGKDLRRGGRRGRRIRRRHPRGRGRRRR